MGLTDKVYGFLVNKVPGIQDRYRKKRNHVSGGGRFSAWASLLYWNAAYYVFHDKRLAQPEKYPYYEEKLLYAKGSESSISCKTTPKKFAEDLSKYDVVSFDVFDTLVLRPFSDPTDLFHVLGHELGYPDFKRIREEMEWKARERKFKKEKHYEVTLEEIYRVLKRETGIGMLEGNAALAGLAVSSQGMGKGGVMEREVRLEETFCFANPFMKAVVEELQRRGKRLVIISDMYLDAGQIKRILYACGYPGFDAYYVSCELRKSKNKGDLYEYVRRMESDRGLGRDAAGRAKPTNEGTKRAGVSEAERFFAHVGDNYISDVEQAKKHGFTPFRYVNVNAVGAPYRPEDMSAITGSIYRGLVNAHIHNGLNRYSREYEYGYIYGGLFVTGYCQFIHEYVQTHGVDQILFLARDGDVLQKAYRLLYEPISNELGVERGGTEKGDGVMDDTRPDKTEYVYWSRLAATKLTAGYFKYDYFRRFLYHKVDQQYTIRQIFESMELEALLRRCQARTRVKMDAYLTNKNVEIIKVFLLECWDEVLESYREQVDACGKYYGKILQECKKCVAVDIGWAGSGAITLDYMVNQVWKMDCEIVGIIAGTNTCHNAEPDSSETFLQSGKLVSYLYSQRENRDIWKLHDAGKNHNLYWEMLLDAPTGSLKGFYLDENGKCECRFKKPTADMEKVREIQKGILDFVEEYKGVQEKVPELARVSGRDAYAPMVNVEREVNREFVKGFEEGMDEVGVG